MENSLHIKIDIFLFVDYSRSMDTINAVTMFDALSQETRLGAFRLLVKAGPKGLAAGALSDEMGTPHNTMSFHLSDLTNAGIISARREGRFVI